MLEFRNKRTHEYRKVEEGSDEHLALLEERGRTDLRPIWEQVGRHTRQAAEARAEAGVVVIEDQGEEDRIHNVGENSTREKRAALPDFRASGDVARENPTPAELKDNEGRAAEGGGAQVTDDSAETLRGDPSLDTGPDPDDDGESSNYEDQSVDDLKDEADRRGLEVEGSGQGGRVLKDDLVAALQDSDDEGGGDHKVGEQDSAVPGAEPTV